MFLKRFLVTCLVIAIGFMVSLPAQNICYASLILEGQLFEHGEKLSAEQAVKMTLRIYDDEFGGNLLFEENQEVTIGSEKVLLTFEKGEITVQKRTTGLTTETMWVEVESNGQIMTPRLNLAEIGTVNDLAGSSLILAEASLRTAGVSTLTISDNGVTLGGLLDMGSESIRLGTVSRSTWPDGGSCTETDPTVLSSVKDGVSWSEISQIPTGFSDGVDNNSGGDITGVTAGTGLTGGGTSGNVTLNTEIPFTLSGSTAGGVIRATNSYGFLNSAAAYAVHGKATGWAGTGVYGESGASAGLGVYGYASSTFSTGVYAKSLNYNGLKATTEASGYHAGIFSTTVGVGLDGAALYALNNNSSGSGVALWAHNDNIASTDTTLVVSNDGSGALLKGFGGSGGEHEIEILNNGFIGIYNDAHTRTITIDPQESGTTSGGQLTMYAPDGSLSVEIDGDYAGHGNLKLYNDDGDLGVYLDAGGDYAADFYGKVRIRDSAGTTVVDIGEGLDYAEGFNVSNKELVLPGSVLVIDPDNPGHLKVSESAYDCKVAGIVAGANGVNTGVRLGADKFDNDVALAGRVYCNVDATQTEINAGDLLTTSSIPGYAMKVDDYSRAHGAILGKAMEPIKKGQKGQILVLVTLQ